MNWGLQALTVRYAGRVAVQDVTLELPAGEVTCVVGGDGAGKTTLLRALAAALRPDEGEVLRPDPRHVGYLPSGSGVYPDLSVEENLAFAAAVYGLPPARALEEAEEYLRRTGLAGARQRPAGALSGGMRQKLGVICAMLHRPKLLVLDEPTTGVDPVSRADLWWLIARAAAEGAAVVVATTTLDEAERASQVLFLHAGRALARGTPAEIVRAMAGQLRRVASRPRGEAARRAWRRGASWRVWYPAGHEGVEGEPVAPDLQDALTVLALLHELRGRPEEGDPA